MPWFKNINQVQREYTSDQTLPLDTLRLSAKNLPRSMETEDEAIEYICRNTSWVAIVGKYRIRPTHL